MLVAEERREFFIMYRQFMQQPFQPLPGQTWDFMQPFAPPSPGPVPPSPEMPMMTFEEMYRLIGEMYEMVRGIYEQECRE